MPTADRWLRFEIAGNRYALPVQAVAQVVALRELRPVDVAGWAGLLALSGGALPLASGCLLVGGGQGSSSTECLAPSRGVVLRGSVPLGFTVDTVHGVVTGASFPIVGASGFSPFSAAALPSSSGSTIVLDATRLRDAILDGLDRRADGSMSLRPLVKESAPVTAAPAIPGLPRSPVASPAVPERELAAVGPAVGAAASAGFSDSAAAETAITAPSSSANGAPSAGSGLTAQPLAPVAPLPLAPASKLLAVVVLEVGKPFEIAVPMEAVVGLVEVAELQQSTGGPAWADGQAEWRGRPLPAIDLRARLGGRPDAARGALILSVGSTEGALALFGGEILGSARLPGIGPGSADLGVPKHWVVGVAARGTRSLVVVDPSALVVA